MSPPIVTICSSLAITRPRCSATATGGCHWSRGRRGRRSRSDHTDLGTSREGHRSEVGCHRRRGRLGGCWQSWPQGAVGEMAGVGACVAPACSQPAWTPRRRRRRWRCPSRRRGRTSWRRRDRRWRSSIRSLDDVAEAAVPWCCWRCAGLEPGRARGWRWTAPGSSRVEATAADRGGDRSQSSSSAPSYS